MTKKNKGSGHKLKTKGKNFINAYNAKETKGSFSNAGLKTLVDVVLGATVGAGIGAVTGKQAKWVGLSMIGLGHYFGDRSGVLRVAGASAIAYGIAKHFENEQIATSVNGFTLAGESSKAKTRLTQFKDEALATFYLDKIFKGGTSTNTADSSTNADGSVGAIDLSALDFFDNFNRQEADEFESQNAIAGYSGYDDDNEELSLAPEFAYSIINDEPDFSKM